MEISLALIWLAVHLYVLVVNVLLVVSPPVLVYQVSCHIRLSTSTVPILLFQSYEIFAFVDEILKCTL